jgi:hypothetical protein
MDGFISVTRRNAGQLSSLAYSALALIAGLAALWFRLVL